MRITQEEALRRLNSAANLVNLKKDDPVEMRPMRQPAPHVTSRIPESLRDTMAALSTEGGLTQRQTAEVFGVSQSVVAQSATGKIGGKPATEDRVAKRISREENIKDTALTKLMMTLGLINQEKLEDLDAKGLAQVGSHLAKVSQSLTPQQNAGNQVQLVVYAPQMRDEGRFKVKEI